MKQRECLEYCTHWSLTLPLLLHSHSQPITRNPTPLARLNPAYIVSSYMRMACFIQRLKTAVSESSRPVPHIPQTLPKASPVTAFTVRYRPALLDYSSSLHHADQPIAYLQHQTPSHPPYPSQQMQTNSRTPVSSSSKLSRFPPRPALPHSPPHVCLMVGLPPPSVSTPLSNPS